MFTGSSTGSLYVFGMPLVDHLDLYASWAKNSVAKVAVSSVSIVGGAAATYAYLSAPGATNSLAHSATVLPANATNRAVNWQTSDADIATVNANGLVTFTGKEGTVSITVVSADDPTKTFSKVITVVKNVTNIRVALAAYNVSVKKSAVLVLVLDDGPVAVTGAAVTYTSAKPAIAKVDAKGKVTGVKAGKTTVTIAASNKTLTVKITVAKKVVKIKGAKLSGTPKGNKMAVGKSMQLKIKLSPAKATDLKVTYKSSNKNVISVDSAGKITALKKGTATITVKVGNKTVKTKKITVK